MNITLTDKQFEILKDEIVKEIINSNKEQITKTMRIATNSLLNSYEINDLIKREIPKELKELVLSKIDINALSLDVTEKVKKHCQSQISKIISKKVNFNIQAKIENVEQENE